MKYFEADDLEAFANWWLSGGKKTRSASTLRQYRYQYKRFLAWAEANDVTTFTIRSAQGYVAHCRAKHEWSAVEAARALKAYGVWIAIDDPGAVDPVEKLELPARPETVRTPVAGLTDIEKLLATCAGDTMEDARDRAIICLLRASGMRRGELALMEWPHIDRDELEVRLPARNTKSGKGRTVAYDPDTQQALRLYVRRLDRWQDDNRRDFSHTDRVWVGRLGPLTSNGIGQMIERRARLAGVDITTHSFRRSLAVRWLRDGKSETLLQRVAGWADPAMVGRYTKVVQEAESLVQQRALLHAEASERRKRGERGSGGPRGRR